MQIDVIETKRVIIVEVARLRRHLALPYLPVGETRRNPLKNRNGA
jgi:hypothetical protein